MIDKLSITHDASHGPLWQPTSTLVSPPFPFGLCGLAYCPTMALVDFYQLAVLYNQHCRDVEFLSKHSYPPMSTPKLSLSPLTKRKAYSSLPHTFAVPRTPPPRGVAPTVIGLTPISRGSSMRRKQEGNTERIDRYDRAEYEDYIREDLSCRVFVDYEVFMKRVLHVPDDWKTQWSRAIKAIKADAEFKEYHGEYCKLCEENGGHERNFYPALVGTANAILGVLARSRFRGIPLEKRQYYYVSDPVHLNGGVMSLSPDLVLLHENRAVPDETNKTLHWANPLQVLEVKPYDNALCDGRYMPRLVVGGKDAR